MAKALEIPQDVIDEVVSSLNMAIGFAMAKNDKSIVEKLSETAVRLDEAINDALATEE